MATVGIKGLTFVCVMTKQSTVSLSHIVK